MNETVKAEISHMLDEIEDEDILFMIKEDIAYYVGDKDIVDDLTEEQLQELDEAIKETDSGKTTSWEDFKKEMEGWKKR